MLQPLLQILGVGGRPGHRPIHAAAHCYYQNGLAIPTRTVAELEHSERGLKIVSHSAATYLLLQIVFKNTVQTSNRVLSTGTIHIEH